MTLPTYFQRTGTAYEPLTDAEALPLIEQADTNPDGEARRVALSRLGRAGIFCDPNWVPLARKPVPVSEQVSCFDPEAEKAARAAQGKEVVVEASAATEGATVIIPALVQAVKGCRVGRQRHRYLPGGKCRFCEARDPRKPQGKPSLADILKAEKSALNAAGSNPACTAPCTEEPPGRGDAGCIPHGGTSTDSLPESVAVSPLPVPAPDSPAGAVEEPDTSAVPAIPTPAEGMKVEATPITSAVSFAEAMGELEAALSPNLSGDDGYAAWVVGKILDRQAQIQRVEAQAREMVAQLHSDLSGLAYRFKAPLQEYARRLIEASGRKGSRSVKTLAGTLGFRGGEDCKPTLSVSDPERLREWCLEQPDAEQFGAYTFVPDKQKILAWAKATGEVPRGVEAKAQSEAFYVSSGDGLRVNLSKLSAPALPAPDEIEEE